MKKLIFFVAGFLTTATISSERPSSLPIGSEEKVWDYAAKYATEGDIATRDIDAGGFGWVWGEPRKIEANTQTGRELKNDLRLRLSEVVEYIDPLKSQEGRNIGIGYYFGRSQNEQLVVFIDRPMFPYVDVDEMLDLAVVHEKTVDHYGYGLKMPIIADGIKSGHISTLRKGKTYGETLSVYPESGVITIPMDYILNPRSGTVALWYEDGTSDFFYLYNGDKMEEEPELDGWIWATAMPPTDKVEDGLPSLVVLPYGGRLLIRAENIQDGDILESSSSYAGPWKPVGLPWALNSVSGREVREYVDDAEEPMRFFRVKQPQTTTSATGGS